MGVATPRGDQNGDRLALGVGEAHDEVRLQREPEGADAGGEGGGNMEGAGGHYYSPSKSCSSRRIVVRSVPKMVIG